VSKLRLGLIWSQHKWWLDSGSKQQKWCQCEAIRHMVWLQNIASFLHCRGSRSISSDALESAYHTPGPDSDSEAMDTDVGKDISEALCNLCLCCKLALTFLCTLTLNRFQ
jgi:hypothetical protein